MLYSLGHPDGLDPSLSCYWTVALASLALLGAGFLSRTVFRVDPTQLLAVGPSPSSCFRLRTLPGMAASIPVTHTLDLAGSLTPCPVSLTVIR